MPIKVMTADCIIIEQVVVAIVCVVCIHDDGRGGGVLGVVYREAYKAIFVTTRNPLLGICFGCGGWCHFALSCFDDCHRHEISSAASAAPTTIHLSLSA